MIAGKAEISLCCEPAIEQLAVEIEGGGGECRRLKIGHVTYLSGSKHRQD